MSSGTAAFKARLNVRVLQQNRSDARVSTAGGVLPDDRQDLHDFHVFHYCHVFRDRLHREVRCVCRHCVTGVAGGTLAMEGTAWTVRC